MRIRHFSLSATVFLAMLAQVTRGDVILSNFTDGFLSNTNTMLDSNFTSTAMGFTMTKTLPLQSAEVQLRALGGSSIAQASLSLYNDSGGSPGSLLFSFNPSTVTISGSAQQDLLFTPSSPQTLQSGTSYWLVLNRVSVVPTWTDKVAGDPGPVIPVGPGASHLGVKDFVSGSWIDASPGEYRIYQLASSVPEPSSMTLIAAVFMTYLFIYICRCLYTTMRRAHCRMLRESKPSPRGDGFSMCSV
jgi:hypothetical protein